MTTVALITTTAPERCGIRTYAEEICRHIENGNGSIRFRLIGRPFTAESVLARTEGADIVHILHVHSLYPEITTQVIQKMKARGQKTICTYNDSTSMNRGEFTAAFDRTIVHQPTSDGFQLIYHGIPEIAMPKPYTGKFDGYIGTSGFPIAFKQYPLAAKLAHAVGKKLYAILPESQHADVNPVIAEITRNCPGSIVDISFPEHDKVLDQLAQCCFTLYPYSHAGTGIGGSARMGMATGRPVVISQVVRFADILADDKYSREFYIIPSGYPTFENSLATVQMVIDDLARKRARVPKQTIEDMGWSKVSKDYERVYKELGNGKAG